MITDTSLLAYYDTIGDHATQREKVLYALVQYPYSTDKEVSLKLGMAINVYVPRRHELMKMGKIQREDKRQCTITRRLAYCYRISEPPAERDR